jgi:hypothetical protein
VVADTSTPIARPGGTASVVRLGDQSTRAVSEASLGGESSPATIFLDRRRGASRRSLRSNRCERHSPRRPGVATGPARLSAFSIATTVWSASPRSRPRSISRARDFRRRDIAVLLHYRSAGSGSSRTAGSSSVVLLLAIGLAALAWRCGGSCGSSSGSIPANAVHCRAGRRLRLGFARRVPWRIGHAAIQISTRAPRAPFVRADRA